MFAVIPIIGNGTRDNPYRPDVPDEMAWSAQIPTDEGGVPTFLEAPAWFDEDVIVPSMLTSRLRSKAGIVDWLERKGMGTTISGMVRPPQIRDVQAVQRVTLASDDFTRADNADLGASWDAGYTAASNAQIVGNRVRPSALNLEAVETYNAVAAPDEQWVQVTIATFAGSIIQEAGVRLRFANPSTYSGYEYAARRNTTGSKSRIAKITTGTFVTLAAEPATAWASSDLLWGYASGPNLAVYRNGNTTRLLMARDESFPAGRVGLHVFVGTSGAVADTEIDDWSFGAILPDAILNMKKSQFPKMKVRA